MTMDRIRFFPESMDGGVLIVLFNGLVDLACERMKYFHVVATKREIL